ncbi:MAG TPA: hypothetical protein PLV93_08045 [Microthrixaceae bacterium]|nr:hypothetical protein [Microthrixaceae bacterium]
MAVPVLTSGMSPVEWWDDTKDTVAPDHTPEQAWFDSVLPSLFLSEALTTHGLRVQGTSCGTPDGPSGPAAVVPLPGGASTYPPRCCW